MTRYANALLVLGGITLVRIYQYTLGFLFQPSCRFTPTCSQYAIDALRKYGFLSGSYRATRRILRCHPFNRSESSYDPA